MCLFISKWSWFWSKKPRIAHKNIIVYKCLLARHEGWCTPFRGKLIKFKKGVGVLSAHLGKAHRDYYTDKICIDEGIHAYRTRKAAVKSKNGFVFYAMIPKGSKYYIGTGKEIVASKMLIFEDKYCKDKYLEEKSLK